jgi:AraC-like DNA-binding protein
MREKQVTRFLMKVMISPQVEREAQREQANREELIERIAYTLQEDGAAQPLKGLYLYRSSVQLIPVHSIVKPSLCVIAQGSKEILLGSNRYRYDASQYLLASVEMPRVSQILAASKERPYLSLHLELDPTLVGSIMLEAGYSFQTSKPHYSDVKAIAVSSLDGELLDAFVRLVRLLDTPTEAEVLMPLILREITYRLLIGEQGARLRHLAILGGYTPLIARAVERLRSEFDEPLRVEEIAHDLGMSVSGFHHHFKAVTSMSPMQFQKQLRLQEARRLMLNENLAAASAAYRVGYHDASHFNREYKSLFGMPPMRDVQRLRKAARINAGQ